VGEPTSLGISGRLARYFIASRLTPLLAIVIALAGLVAVAVTPREEEPQIDVTMANVIVPFPGASAADVERLLAIPAEQELAGMRGVEHVWSVSTPGRAIMTVQFVVGVRRDEAVVRLHDTVLSHRDWFAPELGVGEPVVKAKGIDDVPIVAVTLHARDERIGATDLERVSHAIEEELKRVAGTRDVRTIGAPGREVRVEIDAARLAAHDVDVPSLRRALQAANASAAAGDLVRGNATTRVDAGAFLASADDVRGLVVAVRGGRPVYLSDVADVVDGPPPSAPRAWYVPGKAGGGDPAEVGVAQPAVTLQVTKKAGENAVDVASRVERRLDELRGAVVPEGVEATITRDYGRTADDKAKLLISKLAFATLSVVALVLVTLGRREAATVGVAVLLTLAATLFASWAWGFTLNRVSLFALIFSIGILVDDAIVVVENIHRRRALTPDVPLAELIPAAVDEVGGPTILATLTVIAALLPLAFVSGLMGPYMSPIPINASMGMLISLAVAFSVTPWLALRLAPAAVPAGHGPGWLDRTLAAGFMRLLSPCLDPAKGARHRATLAAGVAVAIALALSLAAMQWVVLKMLPNDNKSELQVVVDLPAGSPVEATAGVLGELAAHLALTDEVSDVQAYAGTASPINFNGLVRQYDLRAQPWQGDLQVNLVDRRHRARKSHDIALAVRPSLEAIGARFGANVKVVEVPPGPPVLAPIVAEIYGPDDAGRQAYAEAVREVFARTPHVVGVDDSIDDAAPGLRVRIDRRKAALAGVAPADAVATLRAALSGEPTTAIFDGQSKFEVPVRLTLAPERQATLASTLALPVLTAGGEAVPLSEIVRVETSTREAARHRKDLLPVTYVIGDVAGGADSPLYGMFAMREELARIRRRTEAPWTSGSSRRRPIPGVRGRSSGTANGRSRGRPSATWGWRTASGWS
jgi:multidrug efflux pump subunit AcrB